MSRNRKSIRGKHRKQKGGIPPEVLASEIRQMIQTLESKYIFPAKISSINTNNYRTKGFTKTLAWNYAHPFTKNVLLPLTQTAGLQFKSFQAFRDWVLTPGTLESIPESLLLTIHSRLKEVQIADFNPEELSELRAVLNYERKPWYRGEPVENENGKPLNNVSVEIRIQRLLAKQAPIEDEILVWRGQKGSEIQANNSWFSCSRRSDIASEYGSDMFKIHVQPGTHVLDMYSYYGTHRINPQHNITKSRAYMRNMNYMGMKSANYTNYEEVIVEGGGSFYKDKEKTQPGFAKKQFSLEEILKEFFENKSMDEIRDSIIQEAINELESPTNEEIEEARKEGLERLESLMNDYSSQFYYETYYFPPEVPLPEKLFQSLSMNSYIRTNTRKKGRNSNKSASLNSPYIKYSTIINEEYPTNQYTKKKNG